MRGYLRQNGAAVLLGTPLPEGPRLTAEDLRSELAEVSAALEQEHSQSAAVGVSL